MQEKKSLRRVLGLFSMKPGRISRSKYWVLGIFHLLTMSLLISLAVLSARLGGLPGIAGVYIAVLSISSFILSFCAIGLMVSEYMLFIRRLRDFCSTMGWVVTLSILNVPLCGLVALVALFIPSKRKNTALGEQPEKMTYQNKNKIAVSMVVTLFLSVPLSIISLMMSKNRHVNQHFTVKFPCRPSAYGKNGHLRGCNVGFIGYMSTYTESASFVKTSYLSSFAPARELVQTILRHSNVFKRLIEDKKYQINGYPAREIVCQVDILGNKYLLHLISGFKKGLMASVVSLTEAQHSDDRAAQKTEHSFMHSFKLH